MDIYGLEDNKTKCKELSDKLISIYNLHGFENEALAIKNEVDIQLEKVTPSIMFYGVYNSGKSSVINALAGEYIAEVGDVPTTSKVEHIKWQGFMLTDTPGIVANDEHTRIADNEIKRHDVILFVVDDMGTFENISITNAIVNIINVGKPIIIVINQKQASEEGVYTKQIQGKIMPKIIENIQIASQKTGIPSAVKAKNFCGIIPVNAMSAYLAKTQYKSNGEPSHKLLTKCGIDELTAAIHEELQKTSGVKILLSAIQIIQSSIMNVRNILKNNLQPGKEKAYYEAVNSINEQKSSLYSSIFNIGKNEILSYGDKIYASAVRGEQVNDFAKQLNENLKKIILDSFANANITLKNQFEFYQVSIGDDYIIDFSKISSIKLELPNKWDDDGDFDLWNIIKDILVLSQNGKVYSKTIMPQPILPLSIIPSITSPNLILTIILELTKLFAGRKNIEEGRRTLEEAAATYNNQIQTAINAQITGVIEINNKIRAEMYKLEEVFKQCVTALVNSAYEEVLKQINEDFECEKKTESNVKITLNVLDEIFGEINIFKQNIT